MSWIYLAIISHSLFAIVFILDKVIVEKLLSPIKYSLIIGGFSGLAVFLIPFISFPTLDWFVVVVSFLSGVASFVGLYFYFKVLLKYEASWVVPFLFGVMMPISTFILGRFFLNETLTFFQIVAFVCLLIGGLILSFGKRYDFKSVLILAIAGVFVSLELVFLKLAFSHTNFLTGYALSRISSFIIATIVIAAIYFKGHSEMKFSVDNLKSIIIWPIGGLATLKQSLSFAGNLILIYVVSIGTLTLINGLGGIRYVFVLFFSVLLSRKWPKLMDEPRGLWVFVKKLVAIFFIILGVLIILLQPTGTPGAKTWGTTFTTLYSRELGLNEKDVLIAALDDLKIREFRIVAYWPEIEKTEGVYDFSDLDFQVNAIKSRNGKIILAVGKRLPRWPECHEPEWAKEKQLDREQTNEKILKYVEATINRYKNEQSIWAWQMENEPFLFGFGECHYVDDEFLDKEISLIRSLDSSRPVILTDSGEFGLWFRAYKRADIFGTTMYRVVLSRLIPIGHFKYPLDPDFFKIKLGIMEMIWGKKQAIGVELQAEPWLEKRPPNVPLDEQLKAFGFNQFKENIEYAREVGFERNYLWGVEWWYWMKEKQNHPEFWEEAQKIFKTTVNHEMP